MGSLKTLRISAISDLPTRTLDAWFVAEVVICGQRRCYLMGWRREGGTGQISSPIAVIDPARRCVKTSEGAVYLLAGRAGLNADAFWLWRRFLEQNNISAEHDLTDEVEALLDARRSSI